jgi:hypothetical protein
MEIMKKIASVMVLLALCIPTLAIDMPNMVGNWTGTAHGVDLTKHFSTQPTGKPVYWDRNYTIVIDEQNGTRFSGKFINDANPHDSELILGVIGSDNKTIALVDETGSYLGSMKSPTEMEFFGSLADLERMDVGVGTFTRAA